ncbi:Uncharacterised protein [Mycobacteroides abscessus subsp. abscessus]|nr:Uncharacterised protein [Mycobacteroides abscessus subsp. abscessus]
MRFFKDALNYDASRQHAVDYINKHIADENVPVALRAPHSIDGDTTTEDSPGRRSPAAK